MTVANVHVRMIDSESCLSLLECTMVLTRVILIGDIVSLATGLILSLNSILPLTDSYMTS